MPSAACIGSLIRVLLLAYRDEERAPTTFGALTAGLPSSD